MYMKLKKHINLFFTLFVIYFFLAFSNYLSVSNKTPLLFISKQDTVLNINENIYRYLNIGQKRLITGILWISTILESDQDHYKNNDLNSWMFLRFNTISVLDPYFYENYLFAGLYLSVVKDDLLGASSIYKKALNYYPNDPNLLQNAAFHFYFETEEYDIAKNILSRLMLQPKVSSILVSSYARIMNQSGNLQLAYDILLKQYEKITDERSIIKLKISEHLYSIKAEMDLNCLNGDKKNCSYKDFFNRPYILNGNEYIAETKWKPFRIKKKLGRI
jgi:tetratricopeptide (TPR) repeat protein